MIPLLLGPYIWDLSQDELNTFNRLDQIIWALFVINLIVKVLIAPRRLSFLKSNILEVIVVIPYLQPLRIVFWNKGNMGYDEDSETRFLNSCVRWIGDY